MIKNLLVLCFASAAIASASNLEKFKTSTKLLTSDIYNNLLVDNEDNILVSAFSLETVLALTQSGAKGETAAEIRTGLHLPSTEEETEKVFKAALPTVYSESFSLQTANNIYVQEDYPIKQAFQNVAAQVYNAHFQNIDFARSAEAATEINDWVAQQTGNKIQDMVASGDLDESTRLVLINALHFQANWSTPFQPLHSQKAAFFANDGLKVQVDTMYHSALEAKYFESKRLDATILELPFNGNEATMTFVVPNQVGGISNLDKQMTAALEDPEYSTEYVELSLPKFKIESTINFLKILQKMGVHKAFNPAEADFSGIAGQKGELSIGEILQKTYIDVNEFGVEAAAATIVGIARIGPVPTKTLVIDRPFLFYIKANEIVLFEGRVLMP